MKQLFTIMTICLLFFSCKQTTTPSSSETEVTEEKSAVTNEFSLEAEDFIAQEGMSTKEVVSEGNEVLLTDGKGWTAYQINVPVAGRYKVTLEVANQDAAPATYWIEDYIDNKDGRTYNITGNFTAKPNSSVSAETLVKDGSPLNKGKHEIKLHFDGKSKIDRLKFELMKEHQLTPKTLKQNTKGKEWSLVWADEFDEEGAPDESKWTYDIGDWGWGNNELQYYTERKTENARLEGGNLVIEALKNKDNDWWTSARLTTRGKVSFVHGKIDIRAKVPANKGCWAAAWTLGDEYVDELSWPYCGEIDILESVGFETDDATGAGKAHATIHCGAYYFKLGNQPTGILDVANISNEFHNYTIEWLDTGMKAFVDGKKYFEYSDTKDEMTWPFDKPQNIILNLAMGGGWGGAEGMDSTITSQKFEIDYVRVYELK